MSTETKFTPGPWNKDSNGDLRGAAGKLVGEWGSGCAGFMRSKESEANGVLRNTAPELYEALSNLLADAELPVRSQSNIDAARRALRKARGES